MMKNITYYFLPTLLIGTGLPLFAQEKDELDEIIVTSTRQDKVIQDVDSNITVVTAETIQQMQAHNLTDTFKYEPGINFESGSRVGVQDVRIRGIGDGRVLVRVDGLTLPDAFEFGPFLKSGRQRFDVANIKQAEIIRGPTSTLYGSRAIGGVVSFATKDPEDYLSDGKELGGHFNIGYSGVNNGKHVGATLAGQISDSLSAMLAFTHRHYHEHKIHSGLGGIGTVREKNNPENNTSQDVLAKVVFTPNDRHRVTLTGTTYQQNIDAEVLSAKNVNSRGVLTLDHTGEDEKKRQAVIVKHEFSLGSTVADSGFWQFSYQNNRADNYNKLVRNSRGQPYTEHKNDTYQSDSFALEAQLNKDFTTGSLSHELVYGLSFSRRNIDMLRENNRVTAAGSTVTLESNFPDSTVQETGIFIQNRIGFADGTFELIPGVRYDNYQIDTHADSAYLSAGNQVAPRDFDESRVSFRLGALYHLNDIHTLFANYSQGFRAPAFDDANVGFSNPARGYGFIPNPDLKPETSEGVELGWRTNAEAGYSSLSVFYTEYDDFIDTVSRYNPTTKFLEFQNINLDKTEIYGVEFAGALDLQAAFDASPGLTLKGSLAYAKGEDKQTGEPLNNISPLSAVLGVAYDSPSETWGVEGLVRAHAGKSDSDISTSQLNDGYTGNSGYAVLDLMGYYRLSKSAKINWGIYNVFDEKYLTWETASNIPADSRDNGDNEAGRYFAATFSYDF